MSVKIFGDGTITGVEFLMPVVKEKRIARFTGDGTWTVPAGVTYAIAHMRGGGGGVGETTTGGGGGSSSVAFSSGTVTANGGVRGNGPRVRFGTDYAGAGAANSGNGALLLGTFLDAAGAVASVPGVPGQNGAEVVAGGNVTPAASITVTVGAGGTAGTNGEAGGSGYVYIEYEINPEDEI